MKIHEFKTKLSQVFNSGQSKSVLLYGNIYDLFKTGEEWVPLIPYITSELKTSNRIQIVYELNGPIQFSNNDKKKIKQAYLRWKTDYDENDLAIARVAGTSRNSHEKAKTYETKFQEYLDNSIGNTTQALEFLRQLTMLSRSGSLKEDLLIIVEGADLVMPADSEARLNDVQFSRISIMQDWLCDPDFTSGNDYLCLVAESSSLVHSRVSKLPQLEYVEVSSPDEKVRKAYLVDEPPIPKYSNTRDLEIFDTWNADELTLLTAGLSIQAIKKLVAAGRYQKSLSTKNIITQVEKYIQSQVGEDVIEFKKPEHTLEDVIGNTRLKEFLRNEMIPRIQAEGKKAIPGAAVGGSIGSGKTFIFEALAAETGRPVLVLKNIRSQWYGQTDVIFEKLRRALEALQKVIIFVDEADTQFGGVGQESHSTERRLTGKIQAMMSDTKLKGKVVWLLMTARIHLLSPDIRRPGRVGDLIIPVLDPVDIDRTEFVKWMLNTDSVSFCDKIDQALPRKTSAAHFASLKSYIESMDLTDEEDIINAINDHISPNIEETRRYQELQALVNCTRKCLVEEVIEKDKKQIVIGNRRSQITESFNNVREGWHNEIKELESKGIR